MPYPKANNMDASSEHIRGPYRSRSLPTGAAVAYWPIMALCRCQECHNLDLKFIAHASMIVLNCGCVQCIRATSAGEISGKVYIPPAVTL